MGERRRRRHIDDVPADTALDHLPAEFAAAGDHTTQIYRQELVDLLVGCRQS